MNGNAIRPRGPMVFFRGLLVGPPSMLEKSNPESYNFTVKASRNDPCPCGSSKKYKKCCLLKEALPLTTSARSAADKKRLVKSSNEFPVAGCLINTDWQESGLANILISRRLGNGNLIIGAYLVDTGCLGLKSTFCNAEISPEQFENDLFPKHYPDRNPLSIEIDHAKEIIFGAIEYAVKLGFDPDPSFNLSRYVLGSKELTQHGNIRFGGPEGKPFFVAGPNDDAPRIIQRLTQRLGKDGFNFMAPMLVP
jgi:hypothetical protein